jgi:pimeloyl-ACP methyl ester carboxylesterase
MTTIHETRTALIDVGDVQLRYWDRGEGPTILLAHAGVYGDWFAPVFDEPALDGFRVVRVHRAGYGASSRPDRHLTFADHARQCCQLLRELGVHDAYWVGHSSGGCIGLQAALDHADLLAGLLLLEPAPKPAGPSSVALREQVVAPALAAAGAGDVAAAADTFLRGVMGDAYRDHVRNRLGDRAHHQLVRDAEFFFTDEIRAAHEWQINAAAAARITLPTLLVYGGETWRQTRACAETATQLAQMLPSADLLEIPGLNHAMPLEDPPAIAHLIATTVNRWTGQRPQPGQTGS